MKRIALLAVLFASLLSGEVVSEAVVASNFWTPWSSVKQGREDAVVYSIIGVRTTDSVDAEREAGRPIPPSKAPDSYRIELVWSVGDQERRATRTVLRHVPAEGDWQIYTLVTVELATGTQTSKPVALRSLKVLELYPGDEAYRRWEGGRVVEWR